MAHEPDHNSFRAAVFSGGKRTETLVVKTKKARSARQGGGLAAVPVARSEARRANQRGADRHRLTAESAVLEHDGKRSTVALVNLSGGGAMVGGKLKVRLWDKVHLVLGEHGEIECSVRWVKGGRIGLEFAHETHVECDPDELRDLLRAVIRKSFPEVEVALAADSADRIDPAGPASDGPQRRAAERHPLIWNGLLFHDYECDVVRIRNISTTGALVQCPVHLPQAATVFLDLDEAGRHEATVSWCRGDQAGLAFASPFDIHALSDARPDVAPAAWAKPDYLDQADGETTPWDDRWRRQTLAQLRQSLAD